MDGRMDGWTDGRAGGRAGGRMDGWIVYANEVIIAGNACTARDNVTRWVSMGLSFSLSLSLSSKCPPAFFDSTAGNYQSVYAGAWLLFSSGTGR